MRGLPGARQQKPGVYILLINEKGLNMFGKIKKVFFTGMFGILYLSFVAQIVYVLGWVPTWDAKLAFMGMLAFEWLALIAARYLSKRSSNSAQYNGFSGRRR